MSWGDKKPYRADLDKAFRLAKMRPLIMWVDIIRSDVEKIRSKITWVDIIRSKIEGK